MAGTVPLYFVTDRPRSLAYYPDVLGFQTEGTLPSPDGGAEVLWASLSYVASGATSWGSTPRAGAGAIARGSV